MIELESPLAGVLPSSLAGVDLAEQSFLDYVNVRGDAHRAAEAVLDITLPRVSNTVFEGSRHVAWWLGPDEWLLVSRHPPDSGSPRDDAAASLQHHLTGAFAAAVDVSSGYTTISLNGSRARDILRKGCPLDFHPRLFGPGLCAQSHYFKAPVAVRPVGEQAFELIVRRSFAEYAARMLCDAAEG